MRERRRKGRAAFSHAPGFAGCALAPPPPCSCGEESSEEKIPARREAMLEHRAARKLIAGAILFAVLIYGLIAAPGFLSDMDSVVPNQQPKQEAAP